jgi:dynein heavy chain
MIAQDKEIVKVILLLTGSIQGTRNKVNEYLNWFSSYEFLFKERIQDKINAFTNKNPSIQDYEDKLKDFTEKEEIISNKIQRYKIGAMELKTEPICLGLISWIKDWKQAFAKDLHNRARAQLQNLTEQTKNLYQNLTRQVKDIDSLGSVMETLEKIRV